MVRTGDDVICRIDIDQVFDVEKKSLVVVALNAKYLKRQRDVWFNHLQLP